MTTPAYASAYSSKSASGLSGGAKIPLTMIFGVNEHVTLADNTLTVKQSGVYAVFCSVRAGASSNGNIALMCSSAMYPNAGIYVDTTHLSNSQMAIVTATAGSTIHMEVMSGSINLAAGINANITLYLLKNLP